MMMMVVDLRPAREVEGKSDGGNKIREPHPQNHLNMLDQYLVQIFKVVRAFEICCEPFKGQTEMSYQYNTGEW